MTKMYLSILMENCDHTICLALPILFYKAYKALLFEIFIFELKAIYSSKRTCILVRQVISLKEYAVVFGKT